VIEGVERFLTSVHRAHLAGRDGEEVSDSEAADDLVDAEAGAGGGQQAKPVSG